MSAKRQELRIVADRFRKTPESDRWEKMADSLNGLDVINTPRELVLFNALVLALDGRDGWRAALEAKGFRAGAEASSRVRAFDRSAEELYRHGLLWCAHCESFFGGPRYDRPTCPICSRLGTRAAAHGDET